MEAAVDLQVQLRRLRVHMLVFVADTTQPRRDVVNADLAHVDAAIEAVRSTAATAEDAQLVARIISDYGLYRSRLGLDRLHRSVGTVNDLVRWSDTHHMAELLEPCRELAEQEQDA